MANALATGSFTIPMMKNSGFRPVIAGGITAAAASGGALVPPIMGAGAYMMLEMIPNIKFLEIAKAALIPAVLYYLSILFIVHFYAKRVGPRVQATTGGVDAQKTSSVSIFEGFVFFGALGALIYFLVIGKTPFRSVTYSLEIILLLTLLSPKQKITLPGRFGAIVTWIACSILFATVTPPGWAEPLVKKPLSEWETWLEAGAPGMIVLLLIGLAFLQFRPMILKALVKSARSGVSLISAAGCVGLVIGIVGLTGAGQSFPNAIVPLAKESELLALVTIMGCSIVLGMGLPSAVCYLLMATLVGPVFTQLSSNPAAPPPGELLCAHLFIFYFGMMSMVTPPVALAAYASSSIAGSKIMPTAFAAFRFSLVGFTLPYMFYYRRSLLLMTQTGGPLGMSDIGTLVIALTAAVLGILSLAAGVAGYFRSHLSLAARTVMLIAAGLLLLPRIEVGGQDIGIWVNISGAVLFALAGFFMQPGAAPKEEEPMEEAAE